MLIYLAQLSHILNGVYQNNVFPLAVGFVASFLKKEFKDDIEVELFKSPVELNEAFLRRKPDVFMLSNYMWNHNLNLAFVKEARKKYNDLLIIMGGPNISLDPHQQKKFLEENPEIDGYVLYEGEVISKEIIRIYLKERNRDQVRQFKHHAFLTSFTDQESQMPAVTNRANRLGVKGSSFSLDDIPSPYLSGLFDKFFIDGERPLIETNRGCPFTCTFCQQGEEYYTKVIHFPIERVRQEILYIAEKIHKEGVKTYAIEVADPNFGMFERDQAVCAALREAQDKTNFPQYVGCSTGKNKAETILANTSLLKLGSIQLRSAMQSMNMEVLEAIKRQNIKLEAYQRIQQEMDRLGLENTADIMLGLPLETKDSHFQGIFDLIDAGVKDFSCLQTIILKGTTLERRDYRQKYGIKTKYRYIPECAGKYNILGVEQKVSELEEIIIGTSTMSFEDYLNCRKLNFLTVLLHNSRISALIYKLTDHLGIKKSELLRHVYLLDEKDFNLLIQAFLEDTKKEVFEDNRAEDFNIDDPISHNKIFKHVAIALFKHKDVVVRLLKKALNNLLGASYSLEIEEITKIVEAAIISPFEEIVSHSIVLKSQTLKSVFGPTIEFFLSDKQQSIIAVLNSLYKTPEDKINRLLYRLRPENVTLKITYAGVQAAGVRQKTFVEN